jgi:hypothetical protein
MWELSKNWGPLAPRLRRRAFGPPRDVTLER